MHINLSLKTICLLLAALCFLLKGIAAPIGRLDLIALGFFFVTLAVLL